MIYCNGQCIGLPCGIYVQCVIYCNGILWDTAVVSTLVAMVYTLFVLPRVDNNNIMNYCYNIQYNGILS